MILLIDNYDSFTYNLVQRIGELDASLQLHVVRNDKITVDEAKYLIDAIHQFADEWFFVLIEVNNDED